MYPVSVGRGSRGGGDRALQASRGHTGIDQAPATHVRMKARPPRSPHTGGAESMRGVGVAITLWLALLAGAPAISPVVAATVLAVTPLSVNLGALQKELGSAPVRFSMANTGTTDVAVGVRFTTAPNSVSQFLCHVGNDTLSVIRPGQTCQLDLLIFESDVAPPSFLGPGSAKMELVVNDGELAIPVGVSFESVPLLMALERRTQDFGQVQIGQSVTATRQVSNNTAEPLDVSSVLSVLQGPDCPWQWPQTGVCNSQEAAAAASFVLVDSPACHPIPAHGSCTLTVRFSPSAAYAMVASVDVAAYSNSAAIPQSVDFFAVGIPQYKVPGSALAVEYRNVYLGNHFFVTADPLEIAVLDGGKFPDWARTSHSFWVMPGSMSGAGGTSPVCRYLSRPESGISSHFYSASPTECAAVAAQFSDAWLLESNDVFAVYLPAITTGACPAGTSPLYRLYNNRADVNHRFLTDVALRNEMVLNGWVAEGYGPNAVAMCVPQ